MTLAVAVRFPWPELLDSLPPRINRALGAVPAQLQQAILMTADSRWSWFQRGELSDTDDGGVKIGQIDSHAIAIYAGNTAAGQEALGQLRAAFLDTSLPLVDPQEILRSVWRQHVAEGGGLHLCLGFVDARQEAHLIRYGHDDEFMPNEATDIEVLGAQEAEVQFRSRLDDEVKRWASGQPGEVAPSLHPEHWSTIIATIVWRICREGLDPTVGGRIHSGILTNRGAEGRALWMVDPAGEQPRAQRASVTQSEVAAFYDRQSKRGWRGHR